MDKDQNLIGILAGMGPRSTGPFVDMVVDECQRQYGATYDDDFPPMMIYALPTPFYVDRPIDHAALRDTICGGLRKLASTGVAFVAMPCNTAHIYFADLAACAGVPLLNMVDEALRAIPAGAATIALLATRPTAEARVYQSAIERAGLRVAHDDRLQARTDQLIRTIKSSLDRTAAAELWGDLLADLESSGVDRVL
ncbi:MAG TPA: aspartate/glutamate racemase family protein, partial [Roseiflexaceae bacterium]